MNNGDEPSAQLEPAIVVVIEDDERARGALVFQLSTAGLQVVPYSSAESFLARAEAINPDCIVADICLPRMNGLQLLAEIRRRDPFVSVAFITGHADMSIGVQAMRAGALDCLEKPFDDQSLLRVIAQGVGLSRLRRSEHHQRLELEERERSLTPREREVFGLITAGLLNKQVGAELGPSESTIKKHRSRIMKKMGADSFAELVRMSDLLNTQNNRARKQPG